MQSANDLPTLRIALIGDGTGVDDAEVGRILLFGVDVAHTQQAFSDILRFVLVDLASQGHGFQFGQGNSPG